jgi:hypothetical protein
MSDSPNLLDGKKEILYDSDDTLFIAKSIIGRKGELFVPDKNIPKTKKEANINADTGKTLVETRG